MGVLGDSDSAQIRDALFARIANSDQNAREEATIGLSKRKEQRVLIRLIAMLEQETVPDRAIEAAELMLGGRDDETQWTGKEYAAALRQQFAVQK